MLIRGLLLDVEGVLVADKRYAAVPRAAEFVGAARAAGCPLALITNNTCDDRHAILEKLAQAGLTFALSELHTCTSAAVRHLYDLKSRRCLVIGTTELQGIFTKAGFDVLDESDVDAVVVGLDTELTYDRLRLAVDAVISYGAGLVALHHNRILVDSAGRAAPSVGAISAAIEYAAQTEATVIGKPTRAYFQQALDAIERPANQVLVVSDDPLSDLAGAKRMGMHAAFVLSGKYRDERVLRQLPADERPDLVVPAINELLTRKLVRFGD
jgi:HAD superfamily hydrolase (TIGR01458 family)